jgi:hypothetical protein
VSAGEELGTVGYAPGWWVLAGVLLFLVVLWNGGLLVWGRRRSGPPVARPRVRPVSRADYLARIDRIEDDHRQGRASTREAHQQLGVLVRRFVQEQSGVPVTAMTLRELEGRGLPELADLVRVIYPPAFAPEPQDADVARALRRARDLVSDRR